MGVKELNNKKIAVIGAGGVGGYLAGMLAKTFPHVSIVARGKRGESIREKGLILHSGHKGEIVAHPEQVVNCADELTDQEVIFICVKNYSLEEACAQMKNAVTDRTIVVPVMNGVDPGNRTRHFLGKGKVIDALIYCVSFANEDYSITQQDDFADMRIGIVGERSEQSGTTDDVSLLSQLLSEADQDHKVSKNIEVDIWKKYILNCSYSVSTAFYNETIGQLRSDEIKAKEYEKLVYESCAVAKKKEIKIPDNHADVIIRQFYEELRDDATSSLQRDIWAGRSAEIDTFPGYLVKEAKKLGVEVPVSERMYEWMMEKTQL